MSKKDAVGSVAILNVGAGDVKVSFDPSNPAECIRAARIVKDMLSRGYMLLVEVVDGKGGRTQVRAAAFDEKTCEYIIADFDPLIAATADKQERKQQEKDDGESGGTQAAVETREATPTPKRRGRPPKVRVAAGSTRTVAVAPSAGG